MSTLSKTMQFSIQIAEESWKCKRFKFVEPCTFPTEICFVSSSLCNVEIAKRLKCLRSSCRTIWSYILWNYNVNITLIQKAKCSSPCQNQYCLIQLQLPSAWSSRAPTCVQRCAGSTGWSLLLLLVLAHSRMHLSAPRCCRLVLQGPGVPPCAGSSGGTWQKHSLWAQHGKMLLWTCMYCKEKYMGLALVVQRRDGRDMYANRSRIIPLFFLFSTRCPGR